jgi:hypothetical protein
VHKPVRTTYANILGGQITLDRAVKHIANRAGVSTGHGVAVVICHSAGDGCECSSESIAIGILESKWDALESERVHKINMSRLKKKAGEA